VFQNNVKVFLQTNGLKNVLKQLVAKTLKGWHKKKLTFYKKYINTKQVKTNYKSEKLTSCEKHTNTSEL
jgi:hypothetical protein